VRPAALLGVALAIGLAQCTFPNYDFERPPTAGTAGIGSAGAGTGGGGSSGASGRAGSSGAAVSLGGAGAPGEGGVAGMDGLGEGGSFECRGEQWPSQQCPAGCLRRFPEHCYDGATSEQELGVDCGLECQRCSNEQCAAGTDCLSEICSSSDEGSRCHAPIAVTTTAHETDPFVASTAWSTTLLNAETEDGRSFALKDLEVRYYFTRHAATSVTEPMLLRPTEANIQLADGQNQAVEGSQWRVERFERTDGVAYDAYVSVRFDGAGHLLPGDKLTLHQQLLTGDTANSQFDQRKNYSYTAGTDTEALRITVFHQNELLWGLEPRPANPRACFARAVNLNGPPVSVGGMAFDSATAALVTTNGTGASQDNAPFPAVSEGMATMLKTATRLQQAQSFQLPVVNGEYLVYLYAVSVDNETAAGVLTVQGDEPVDSSRFRSQSVEGAGWAWARLGPYRVVVSNDSLTVAVTAGTIHFAGLELWYAE
jgi:hypothetical protein